MYYGLHNDATMKCRGSMLANIPSVLADMCSSLCGTSEQGRRRLWLLKNQFNQNKCVISRMKKLVPLIKEPARLIARRIDTLYGQVKDGDINLSPKYQRGDVWTTHRREYFIDSLLNNVSATELIFNMDSDSNIEECIDGKQRITTIVRFMENELIYKKYKFEDLDPVDQKTFKSIEIPCKVYHNLAESVRMDVFHRTQQGQPLVPAEMINAHSQVDDLRTLAITHKPFLPDGRNSNVKVVAQLAKFCHTGEKFGTSLIAITSFLDNPYPKCKARINKDVEDTLRQYSQVIEAVQSGQETASNERLSCLESLLTLAFISKMVGRNVVVNSVKMKGFLDRLRKHISTKSYRGVNDKIVKVVYKEFVCKEVAKVVGPFVKQ